MEVAITADIHFGVSGRLQDTLWACRAIREYCQVAGIEVVLVLGDLFHDRKSLGIEVLHEVFKFFEETSDTYNQRWIAFPGNHDMFLRHSWNITSLSPLRRHLTIIDELKLLTLNDKRFWVLPFIQYEKAYMRVISRLYDSIEEGDILLTHVGVRGALFNTCFLLKDWSIINFEATKFAKIYTGHFHSRQSIGENLHYPGSPIPFKFDEGDIPHGFLVHNLEDSSHKFVNIWKAGKKFLPGTKAPPQFRTISDDAVEAQSQADVENNYIRIRLQQERTPEEKRVLKDSLLSKGALSVGWMNLSKVVTDKPKEAVHVGVPQREMFVSWIDQDEKAKGFDRSILLRAHDNVIHEGDELYIAESELQ